MKNLTDTAASIRRRKPRGNPLRRLFLSELADMYDAEKQLTHALPIVAKAARADDLKTLVQIHLKETRGHVEAIEQVAESMEVKLPRRTCRAMKGLVRECVGLLVKELTADCRDAAIIMAAQKIEHYEIATYGSLCSLARRLGLTHELALLRSNLYQERMADSLLTGVGKGTLGLGELIKKTSLKKAGAAQAG